MTLLHNSEKHSEKINLESERSIKCMLQNQPGQVKNGIGRVNAQLIAQTAQGNCNRYRTFHEKLI